MLWKAPLFLSTPPSALATRFCKPLSNLHPTSTLPPAARSTACLSIYLHIFVIFRDVNPWAFLSHLFPSPTPLLQRARIKCENSPPAIFSLSLSLSRPLQRSFIVKFALGYGFLSLTRRFSLDVFFLVVGGRLALLLLCRCIKSFRFFRVDVSEDQRKEGTLGRTIRRRRCFLPIAADHNDGWRLDRVYSVVEIFRERKREARGPRRDSKARKLCQPLWNMQARGVARLIRRFTFLRMSESNGEADTASRRTSS